MRSATAYIQEMRQQKSYFIWPYPIPFYNQENQFQYPPPLIHICYHMPLPLAIQILMSFFTPVILLSRFYFSKLIKVSTFLIVSSLLFKWPNQHKSFSLIFLQNLWFQHPVLYHFKFYSLRYVHSTILTYTSQLPHFPTIYSS